MAIRQDVLTEHDRTVLAELEVLTRETYQLWDQEWVGFSWRNYTFDHVIRVRNLARTIATRENGDLRVLEFAATLHDVTKSYDGEIMLRDGQRVVDADGFWLNEKLPPARQNRVTELYERLGLSATVHHYSGARIARALLSQYGYDDPFCGAVEEIILAHLKPRPTSTPAARSLYDADTIDANIGLPAFYRNLRITIHRLEQEAERDGKALDAELEAKLPSFLASYLGEKIPAWIDGKRDDFIPKLTTETGRRLAQDRLNRLRNEVAAMAAELEDLSTNLERGRLAIVRRFLFRRRNPSLTSEIDDLVHHWIGTSNATRGARELLRRFQDEISGIQ